MATSPEHGTSERALAVGRDDYALTPVPYTERYSRGSVAVQRFGQMSALSGFLLGATLGFGMTFWTAFWALYDASLGFVNGVDTLFGFRVNRGLMTLVVGILGTILSAIGILSKFQWFLTILGVSIPPIASIIVVDYYVLRRRRAPLTEGRQNRRLPLRVEAWNPVAIIAWVASFVVGYWWHWGIQSINSLLCAAILYFVLMKVVGLVQRKPYAEFGDGPTYPATAPAEPVAQGS